MYKDTKTAVFVDGYPQIAPLERVRGKGTNGKWIYGRRISESQIGSLAPNPISYMGSNRKLILVAYDVDPNTICWYTGVKVIGKDEDYLFENDLLRDNKGHIFKTVWHEGRWLLVVVSKGNLMCTHVNLIDYLDRIEEQGGTLTLIGNTIDQPDLDLDLSKMGPDQNEITRDLLEYLLKESQTANMTPVFTDEDGEEHYIDHPDTLELLNTILEQAYLPFIAQKVIEGGWRKEN